MNRPCLVSPEYNYFSHYTSVARLICLKTFQQNIPTHMKHTNSDMGNFKFTPDNLALTTPGPDMKFHAGLMHGMSTHICAVYA